MTVVTLGSQLGLYHIVAPLGAGGMGEVFRALDTRLNRDVVVKVSPNSRSREQTLLDHPAGV